MRRALRGLMKRLSWRAVVGGESFFQNLYTARSNGAHVSLAPRLADIKCTPLDAQRVLLQRTLPAYTDLGRRTFPGFDRLPPDAQGALVSLVYNRGGR